MADSTTWFVTKVAYLMRVGLVVVPGLAVVYSVLAGRIKETKRRGWLLTTIAAVVVVPRAMAFHVQYAVPFVNFDAPKLTSSDAPGDLSVAFFVWYLLVDTVLGAVAYSSSFHLLSGWFHHIFYIFFYLYTYFRGCTVAASVTFVLEVPVIVLGCGHINPRLRSDLGFGLVFFLCRILYHLWIGVQWYTSISGPLSHLWTVIAAVFGLHLHWFYKWASGLQRRRRSLLSERRSHPDDAAYGEDYITPQPKAR